jgi:hypothetical protein
MNRKLIDLQQASVLNSGNRLFVAAKAQRCGEISRGHQYSASPTFGSYNTRNLPWVSNDVTAAPEAERAVRNMEFGQAPYQRLSIVHEHHSRIDALLAQPSSHFSSQRLCSAKLTTPEHERHACAVAPQQVGSKHDGETIASRFTERRSRAVQPGPTS